MKAICFSTKPFEQEVLQRLDTAKTIDHYSNHPLNPVTAQMARGFDAVVAFVNDDIGNETLAVLKEIGVQHIALRCAGYNNVNMETAKSLGITVANVPEYSPNAIAEHTIALILALNRKLIKAHNRVRDLNFSLTGLTGFDLHGKTVGVIGTGKIGKQTIKILDGFGCDILAHDIQPDEQFADLYGVEYCPLETLYAGSDIITLHAPLTSQTRHMIDQSAIELMKDGVMLINTSRGGLVDTRAVIKGLKSQKIGYLGIDVYEEEQGLFFEDLSDLDVLQDDDIARLMTFKNVLITAHQAFLTKEALQNIARSTLNNLQGWANNQPAPHQL